MTVAIDARAVTIMRGSTRAVHEVDLVVRKGSWFGIIGANGSGKTSLLRAIAGRLPATMQHCEVDGIDLQRDAQARARQIGFMPPSETLPGPLTCEQLLTLIEPDRTLWDGRIGEVGQAVGLERLLHRRISTCSAGMRQRIALVCAMVSASRVVILDEPFNWLDPVAAMDLRIALRRHTEGGGTLITALHDMITLTACDEGVLLGKGKVVQRLTDADIAKGRSSPLKFEQSLIENLRMHTVLN